MEDTTNHTPITDVRPGMVIDARRVVAVTADGNMLRLHFEYGPAQSFDRCESVDARIAARIVIDADGLARPVRISQ